jgi:hypothetical protein
VASSSKSNSPASSSLVKSRHDVIARAPETYLLTDAVHLDHGRVEQAAGQVKEQITLKGLAIGKRR